MFVEERTAGRLKQDIIIMTQQHGNLKLTMSVGQNRKVQHMWDFSLRNTRQAPAGYWIQLLIVWCPIKIAYVAQEVSIMSNAWAIQSGVSRQLG